MNKWIDCHEFVSTAVEEKVIVYKHNGLWWFMCDSEKGKRCFFSRVDAKLAAEDVVGF